jgi:type VI protein secretion system component Hcp
MGHDSRRGARWSIAGSIEATASAAEAGRVSSRRRRRHDGSRHGALKLCRNPDQACHIDNARAEMVIQEDAMAIWIEFSQPIKKTIKAESASFNMGSPQAAGGGARHYAQPQDFLFSKYHDDFSATLGRYFFKGETIPALSIRFSKLISDKPLVTYKLENALISSIYSIAVDSRQSLLESYNISFDKYEASYK